MTDIPDRGRVSLAFFDFARQHLKVDLLNPKIRKRDIDKSLKKFILQTTRLDATQNERKARGQAKGFSGLLRNRTKKDELHFWQDIRRERAIAIQYGRKTSKGKVPVIPWSFAEGERRATDTDLLLASAPTIRSFNARTRAGQQDRLEYLANLGEEMRSRTDHYRTPRSILDKLRRLEKNVSEKKVR